METIEHQPPLPEGLIPWAPLTRREEELMPLIVGGKTNQQIADALVVSRETIKTHVAHILAKFNAGTKEELRDMLRAQRFIDYGAGGSVRLTDAGRELVPAGDSPMSPEEMLDSCLRIVSAPQGRILRVLAEVYPETVSRDELADRSQASPTSSAYSNNLGQLHSAGMIEYGSDRRVKCADWVFLR